MLLLADRGFYSFALWRAAAATGAHLLWRVKGNLLLPVLQPLPDGSWLAQVNDPAAVARRVRRNGQRRRRGSTLGPDTRPLPGITVRVIEFWLTTTTGKHLWVGAWTVKGGQSNWYTVWSATPTSSVRNFDISGPGGNRLVTITADSH